MSTHGLIAIAWGDGFLGVFNRMDSYPTYLGQEVWEYVQVHGYTALEQAVLNGVNIHTGETTQDFMTDQDQSADLAWIYVVSPQCLTVFNLLWNHPRRWPADWRERGFDNVPVWTATYEWDGPEPNWSHAQCGEDLDRCQHYRWCHDSTLPRPDYAQDWDFDKYHQVRS